MRVSEAVATLVFLTLGLACSSSDPDVPGEAEGPVAEPGLLAVPPLVGRPTDDSVTLNVVSGKLPVELELELDPPGEIRLETVLESGAVRDLSVGGLAPGSEYRYQLTARGGGRT